MRFATIAAALSVVAGASANVVKNVTEYTSTQVVTAYTTYCPLPTTIVENNKTYVVTKATTLTITNCPCTRSQVYTTILPTVIPTTACTGKCYPSPSAPGSYGPSVPIGTGAAHSGKPGNPVYLNGTVPVATSPAVVTGPAAGDNVTKPGSPSSTTTPAFTGSATKATFAGAAMVGLIGVVAALL